MESIRVLSLSLCNAFVMFSFIISVARASSNVFPVTNFGAIGDGKTDNSKAFSDAWKKACESKGGGVEIPKGNYLVKNVTFQGPCKGETYIHVLGNVIAPSTPSLNEYDWILFYSVARVTVFGDGVFDGSGKSAWDKCNGLSDDNCPDRPTSIKLQSVQDSTIRSIKSLNSKMFHFHINGCQNLTVTDIDITAPENSPNTDGVHIANSNQIAISNSNISTGDDCVSMGGGAKNVNITGVNCGPGHGISIGSLGKYSSEAAVSGITVKNCNFFSTQNGLRIKTWASSVSSTTVSDVVFADIRMDNAQNPVVIDQYYCPRSSCQKGESTIQINGVKYFDVKGTSASEVAVDVRCSKIKPCRDIQFSGLNLTMKGVGKSTTARCANSDNEFQGTVQSPAKCCDAC